MGTMIKYVQTMQKVWNNFALENAAIVYHPKQPMEGFKLSRLKWVSLNRVRTVYGRCGFSMHAPVEVSR